MDFPIDIIESITGTMKTLTQSVDIAKWIAKEYRQHKDSRQSGETQDDERMDGCVLKTLYILRQESDRKKLEYIKCFAQNTILNDTCEIDTEGILSFLMDIEQMTWRQICFIEGFNRSRSNRIKISGMEVSDVNGTLRLDEIKKLVNFDYLSAQQDGRFNVHSGSGLLVTSDIRIQTRGTQLATLMDLNSIPIEEIARAFGPGKIQETITY